MNSPSVLESAITRWTRVIALIGLVGMLLLAVITVFEVLSRWLFHMPLPSVSDVSTLVITVSVAFCFPLVFAQRDNITVRMIGNILGPRVNRFLEALGCLIGTVLFCILVWQLWIYTNNVAEAGETTVIVQFALAPWYRTATILFALCIPIQIVVFFDQLIPALTGRGISGGGVDENTDASAAKKGD